METVACWQLLQTAQGRCEVLRESICKRQCNYSGLTCAVIAGEKRKIAKSRFNVWRWWLLLVMLGGFCWTSGKKQLVFCKYLVILFDNVCYFNNLRWQETTDLTKILLFIIWFRWSTKMICIRLQIHKQNITAWLVNARWNSITYIFERQMCFFRERIRISRLFANDKIVSFWYNIYA